MAVHGVGRDVGIVELKCVGVETCVLRLIPVLDLAVFPLIVAVCIIGVVIVVARRRGRGSFRVAAVDVAPRMLPFGLEHAQR